jgi:hypothetical protein
MFVHFPSLKGSVTYEGAFRKTLIIDRLHSYDRYPCQYHLVEKNRELTRLRKRVSSLPSFSFLTHMQTCFQRQALEQSHIRGSVLKTSKVATLGCLRLDGSTR